MKRILARLRAAISPPVAIIMLTAFALMLLRTDGALQSDVSRLERRICTAIERIEGAGGADVIIRTKWVNLQGQQADFGARQTTQEVPCGAIAVVDGADDPYVRMQVMQALCALLGLQAAQVDVLSAAGG